MSATGHPYATIISKEISPKSDSRNGSTRFLSSSVVVAVVKTKEGGIVLADKV